MKRIIPLILLLQLLLVLLSSCQSVKPYQRVYLNEHFMLMGKKPVDIFGEKALTYREGSAGGGTGKSSGGCGCN